MIIRVGRLTGNGRRSIFGRLSHYRKRELDESLEKGYWTDFGEVANAKTDGRVWEWDSKRLVPASKCFSFPQFNATSINGKEISFPPDSGNPTLIAVYYRDVTRKQASMWIDGLKSIDSNLAVLEISVIEQFVVHQLLWKMFKSSLHKQLNDEAKSRTVEFPEDFHEHRVQLGIENRLTAHIFLVDAQGLVRAYVTGAPSSNDELYDIHELAMRTQLNV